MKTIPKTIFFAGALALLSAGCGDDTQSSTSSHHPTEDASLDSGSGGSGGAQNAGGSSGAPHTGGTGGSSADASHDTGGSEFDASEEPSTDAADVAVVDAPLDQAPDHVEDAETPTPQGSCAQPVVIGCNETVQGNTAYGDVDMFHDYPACSGATNLNGKEVVYQLQADSYQNVGLQVSPTAQSARILQDSCDSSSCVGTNAILTQPNHSYYVVVDSTAANAGPFSLTTSCSAPDLCMGWTTGPTCSVGSVAMTNDYSENAMEYYGCAPGLQEPGDEAVWEVTVQEPSTITATLVPPAGVNLDLFLLRGICHPTTCDQSGTNPAPGANETITFTIQPGERALLVVDNPSDWIEYFQFMFSCTTP